MSQSKAPEKFIKEATYIVDASSFIFRAYYGMNSELQAPDGTPTFATYTFVQMVKSLIKENDVKKIALVWDTKHKNFRHKLYPEYKANRGAPPEDLGIQIENAQKICAAMGIVQIQQKGFEADDILASFVWQHPQEKWVVVTGDKDLMQLVSKNVWLLDTMKKKWSNEEACLEKFGVPPNKVKLVQALSGDSVDNIPGVPGVGAKTATALIKRYQNLELILEEAQKRYKNSVVKGCDKEDPLKGKKIENIATNIKEAKLSLKLVSLSGDVPVEKHLSQLERQEANVEKLHELGTALGFKNLLKNISEKDDKEISKEAAFKVVTVDKLKQLVKILDKHEDANLLCLDTETFGLSRIDSNMVGLSFCFNEEEAYYVPFRHEEDSNLKEQEEALKTFNDYISSRSKDPDFRLLFQNAKFDLHVLDSEKIQIHNNAIIEDTMLAHFVLDPSGKHGMDSMAIAYLDGYECLSFKDLLGKDKKNISEVDIERCTFYACEDVIITYRLWQVLKDELEDAGLTEIYEKIDRPLAKLLFEMEQSGFLLDTDILHSLSKKLHKELAELDEGARMMIKEDGFEDHATVNFASSKQMAVLLFEHLDLPIIKKGKTGPSTDMEVLNTLSAQHPFPKLLLEMRELSKLLSTYIDAFAKLINPKSGRIHSEFSQTVAATGRLASSSPNLQNIPIRTKRGALIRNAFIAKKGYQLLCIDYSQVELRILAHVSKDPELLKSFKEDADIHSRTAALVFDKTEAKVSSDERRMAKAINFGIIYGQSAFGLAKQLGITRKEASDFIDAYFSSYPEIKNYMDKSIDFARSNGFVQTLCGRRRYLEEIHSKNAFKRQFAERIAVNSPIQGTAADLMKIAMVNIQERLKSTSLKAQLLLQVHDELIYEVKSSDAQKLQSLVEEEMQASDIFKDFGVEKFKVPLKTNTVVAPHWTKA